MTLSDFLSALSTDNVQVTLKDASGTLITFTSGGYASVESDILAREVSGWALDKNNKITVTLAAA